MSTKNDTEPFSVTPYAARKGETVYLNGKDLQTYDMVQVPIGGNQWKSVPVQHLGADQTLSFTVPAEAIAGIIKVSGPGGMVELGPILFL